MDNIIRSFFIAFLVSALAGRLIIRLLTGLKFRQNISEDAPARHLEKQGTPTMGGLIIVLGALAGLIAASLLWPGWREGSPTVVPVAAMTLAFMALGLLDDYLIVSRGKNLGLKARHKLLGQFVIAIGFVVWLRTIMPVGLTDVYIPFWKNIDFGSAYYPLAVLLIVGMSNAVNLTDGLDGLAAGLSFGVMLALGLLTDMFTVSLLPDFCGAVAGGCLGFLWYNANPARVFMGDTGSLALGGAVAGVALAAKVEFLALIAAAIFIVEALSVIIQVISFKATGTRVFKMTPIHHHFELSGWAEQKVVSIFWIVQALLSALVVWLALAIVQG